MTSDDRGTEPIAAAVRVAARYGYVVEDPVLVQETNNTVVWLRPNEIIAKVGTWSHSEEALRREHTVATALAATGTPIAPPVGDAEPVRDEHSGFLVTLWQRLEHDAAREPSPDDVAEALRRLHEGLARYRGELPSFREGVRRARAALDDDRLMAALGREDRSLLRRAFDRLVAELEAIDYVERPLHGEPHLDNLLATANGLRWIDLEAVCIGPLEWDVAFLSEEAASLFPEVDAMLLDLLRTLNSARVAAWCWARADVGDMRTHGRYHLELVRLAESRSSLGRSATPPDGTVSD
ncbi:MAG: phosphotransferase enzyme family protein [Actinomycetota bacterium]